ncbi:E1a binding protein P400 [Sarcoptes scabiei]|nr:E1a binding protein P400 [Sarcoptes scabiei]
MSISLSETMPIWAPPTPPQDENDFYVDYSLGCLYDRNVMTESQLPPVYVPKDHNKRLKIDHSGRKQSSVSSNTSIRRDDVLNLPKSLFDRATSMINRLRLEIIINKLKLWPGSQNIISSINRVLNSNHLNSIPPRNYLSSKHHNLNPNMFPRWNPNENYSLFISLYVYQGLPFNLSAIFPGHIVNWDFVSDQINAANFFKRSAKLCRIYFDSLFTMKEDQYLENLQKINSNLNKSLKSAKKSKNNQGVMLPNQQDQPSVSASMNNIPYNVLPHQTNPSMANDLQALHHILNPVIPPVKNLPNSNVQLSVNHLLKTAKLIQNIEADNNRHFTSEMIKRFAIIKQIVIQKTPTSNSFPKLQKKYDWAPILNEYQIDYNSPMSLSEIASRRLERHRQIRGQQIQLALKGQQQQQQQLQQQQQVQQSQPQQLQQQSTHGSNIDFSNAKILSQPYKNLLIASTTTNASATPAQIYQTSAQNLNLGDVCEIKIPIPVNQGTQPQQILINKNSGNCGIVTSQQQLQQLFASKIFARITHDIQESNMLQTQQQQQSQQSNSNVLPASVKLIATSSPNALNNLCHHVSLSQAQSLGLIGQGVTTFAQTNSTPQSSTTTTTNETVSSAIVQNHPKQSSQQAATLQESDQQSLIITQQQASGTNQSPKPIPVNVSIPAAAALNQQQQQSQQMTHKLFAISNANSNASLNSAVATPQSAQKPPIKSILLKQRNSLMQNQSLQASNIQIGSPTHSLQMQQLRNPSNNTATRYQLVATGANLPQTIISGAALPSKIASANSSTTTMNVPNVQTLIGTQSCALLTPTSGQAVTTISGKSVGQNTLPLIARSIRRSQVQIPASNSVLASSNANQCSQQVLIHQHQPVVSSSSVTDQISSPQQQQQSISLSGGIIKAMPITASNTQQPSSNIRSQIQQCQTAGSFNLSPSIQQAGGKIQTQSPIMIGNQLRFLQKSPKTNPTPNVASQSTTTVTSGPKIVLQHATGTLINNDQQTATRATNIIAPILQVSNAGSNPQPIKPGTFHFVSSPSASSNTVSNSGQTTLLQQPMTTNKSASLQAVSLAHGGHGPLKGNIIVQQAQSGSGIPGSTTSQTVSIDKKQLKKIRLSGQSKLIRSYEKIDDV